MTTTTIVQLTAEQASPYLPDLVEILRDAVNSGASISFLPPLSVETAESYWRKVFAEVGQGNLILLVALQNGHAVGTIQLAPAGSPNGSHRAEVQKLIVHSRARNQGIARLLLTTIEDTARRMGRTLLFLDTKRGDTAEHLYEKYGYTRAGIIPQFAQDGDGNLCDTVFFYRLL
jgi:ribosomal protein S18 acetylase RimI-like enzyme